MDAQALIGMVLGTCTLQKLIGQGGMGAVFLAQQSRPRRQVAVKVLLPVMSPTPAQRAAFLERFRRETDTAASLQHPNIMPVHEYGELDGLAYLVMPYISGGTLRDELEKSGQLSYVKILSYLEQIAAALDMAHARGVVHRDVKPANILLTEEGRLVLSDFGLVKILAEGQNVQRRLTGDGVPLGTPDYMAPEQVQGGEIDARADIYSLGCILYHMVTGSTLFKGEMPLQVALQHLNAPPPSPRMLRPDLPPTVEQVMLQALAKRPVDRYLHAQDLVNAFRVALTVAGAPLTDGFAGNQSAFSGVTEHSAFTPRGLFDPMWQRDKQPQPVPPQMNQALPGPPWAPAPTPVVASEDGAAKTGMALPSFVGFYPSQNNISPSPMVAQDSDISAQNTAANTPLPQMSPAQGYSPNGGLPGSMRGMEFSPSSPQAAVPWNMSPAESQLTSGPVMPATTRSLANLTGMQNGQPVTSALQLVSDEGTQGTSTTVKLAQSMRVVQVPVAGQPGRYLTGLLPVLPENPPQEPVEEDDAETFTFDSLKGTLKRHTKLMLLLMAIVVVLASSGAFLLLQTHSRQNAMGQPIDATPDAVATAAAYANATAQANTILTDSLSENVHDWRVANSGPQVYVFNHGAYHITNNDMHAAIALLPDEMTPAAFAYTLNVVELRGDDTSIDNQFGLILDYRTIKRNGRIASMFYFFDAASAPGGGYQFWKYDDSFGPGVNPWTELWARPFGKEYHFGHGATRLNVFKAYSNKGKFILSVNGKRLGVALDNSLTTGQVGMLVNLRGTEVAFSNLVLSYS